MDNKVSESEGLTRRLPQSKTDCESNESQLCVIGASVAAF